VREEKVAFYSDGLKLDASIYRGDAPESQLGGADGADALPVVITCSGFQGFNATHPARFARALTPRGYTCFGFDYRGFAASEGTRGAVHVEEQIRDIANAVRFVRSTVKPRALVLSGWAMGGGLVLEAARIAEGVDALVVMNPIANAVRVQRAVRGEEGYRAFRAWLDEERARLVGGGELRLVEPFDIYPLDPETKGYCDDVLAKNPEFGRRVFPSFADSLLRLTPEACLDHLSRVPLLLAHGDRNALHPPEEARSLFDRYPGPKHMHWVPDAGHTEWMLDGHPKFVALVEALDAWIRRLPATRAILHG
jgi:pimeloyl-ACP methyl ester carboxylesterase